MKTRIRQLSVVFLVLFLFVSLIGCAAMKPTSQSGTNSVWKTFIDFKINVWDKIVKGMDTVRLSSLGIVAFETENTTYLDQSGVYRFYTERKAPIPDEIKEAQANSDNISGLLIKLNERLSEEQATTLHILLGTKQKLHITGFDVEALIVIKNKQYVLYKEWEATPKIDKYRNNKDFLKPFKFNPGELIFDGVKDLL